MNNLSDGKSDGIVIMYVKDGVVYPVALKKDQIEFIDFSIGMMFGKLSVITDHPQGKIKDLLENIKK